MAIRSGTAPIELFDPNPWNPNKMDDFMFQKELKSISKFGFVNPVLVRQVGHRWQIIDGEHRVRACKKLGFTKVEYTEIVGLSDIDAKQLTIVLNETRGRPDPEKLGSLLTELTSSVSVADLLDVLPLSAQAFERLTNLTDFDWGSTKTASDILKPANSWVERTYRMPREAADVLDQAIEKAKSNEEMTEWQAIEMMAAEFLASA